MRDCPDMGECFVSRKMKAPAIKTKRSKAKTPSSSEKDGHENEKLGRARIRSTAINPESDSENKQRLGLILEATTEGYWDWNIGTGDFYYGPGWPASLGYAMEDLPKDISLWESIVHPDDYLAFEAQLKNHLAGKDPSFDFECRLRSKSGHYKWFRQRGKVIDRDRRGRATRMVGTILDVEDRRNAAEQLAKSQAQLSTIFEASSDYIFSVDASSFGLMAYNAAFSKYALEHLGCRLHEGMTPAEVLPSERAEIFSGLLRRSLTEGDFRTDYQIADGRVLHLSFHRLVKEGSPFGISVFSRDVTERRRTEEALRQSEEKFAKAFLESPMALALTSLVDHRYLEVNETFEQLSGYSREEIIGKTPFDIQILLDGALRYEYAERVQSQGRLRNVELKYRTKAGELRDGQGSAELIEIDGEPCMLAVIADVTEARRSERILRELSGRLINSQEEERRRVGRELHDGIGQHLALLAIRAQRIDSGESDAEGTTRSEIHELHRKIKEIATKVSELSHRLHSSELEFLGLAIASERLCRDFAKQYGIEIDYQVKSVPRLDNKVALCFYRIIQESLRNVGKHSKATRVTLELTGTADGLRLTVHDDGIGFNPEAAQLGSGLGLLSMRERMNLIGGKLDVRSAGNKGTRITASLSLPQMNTVAMAVPLEQASQLRPPGGGK